MSLKEHQKKRSMLIWVAVVPLAICLVYSLFNLASNLGLSLMVFSNKFEQSSFLSSSLNLAVWGVSIFLILAWLGYNLEFNTVKGYYRSSLGGALLVAICSMAIGAVLAILGFVGMIALVPISVLLLILCVLFSPDVFSMDRVPFILRLLVGVLIVGLLFELVSFLV